MKIFVITLVSCTDMQGVLFCCILEGLKWGGCEICVGEE
jgi:hypothetical protein